MKLDLIILHVIGSVTTFLRDNNLLIKEATISTASIVQGLYKQIVALLKTNAYRCALLITHFFNKYEENIVGVVPGV